MKTSGIYGKKNENIYYNCTASCGETGNELANHTIYT